MNKLTNLSLAALISLASESCVTNKYCTSIDLENKRRLETCINYDNGKPSHASYTLFNGWNRKIRYIESIISIYNYL